MSENEGAITTSKPNCFSAQTACSREEPEPKFRPETRIGCGSSSISPERNQS